MPSANSSYVYFLRPIGKRGPVKIGSSSYPRRRLLNFMAWSPVSLEVAATVPGGLRLEQRLHAEFADYHSHGEWFRACAGIDRLISGIRDGLAIGDLIDLDARPNKALQHWTQSPEMRRRSSYAARVRMALQKVDKGRHFYAEPEKVSEIFSRWHVGPLASADSRLPSEAELALLERLIADPTRYGTRLERAQW